MGTIKRRTIWGKRRERRRRRRKGEEEEEEEENEEEGRKRSIRPNVCSHLQDNETQKHENTAQASAVAPLTLGTQSASQSVAASHREVHWWQICQTRRERGHPLSVSARLGQMACASPFSC